MDFDFDMDFDQSTWDGATSTMLSLGSPLTSTPDFSEAHQFLEPSWFVSPDDIFASASHTPPSDVFNSDRSSCDGSDYACTPDYAELDPDHHASATTSLKPYNIDPISAIFYGLIDSQPADQEWCNQQLHDSNYAMMGDSKIQLELNPTLLAQNKGKARAKSPSLDGSSRNRKRSSSEKQERGEERPTSRPRISSVDARFATTTAAADADGAAEKEPIKLRTATRTSKKASAKTTANKPPVSEKVQQSRASHNVVEKHYRNRLNQQFERLLDALPTPAADGDDGVEGSNDHPSGNSRRFSKGDVLEMARRRIKALERDNKLLMAGRSGP